MLKRFFLAALILFTSWLFIWALFFPKESVTDKVAKKLDEQKKKADFFMKGVTFSEIVNGVKYWEIKSITSQINKSTGRSVLNDVAGTFFKDGRPSVNFVSPRVFWNMDQKEIKIESPSGESGKFRFETGVLNWSMSSEKITTNDTVKIGSGNIEISGRGMASDTGFERIELKGEPVARVKERGGVLEIKARAFVVDAPDASFGAEGDASATKGDLSIACGKITYQGSKELLLASGDVDLKYKDIKGRADTAVYDIKKQSVILAGNARATRGDSELNGERLKIDLKNNKITIEGRSRVVIDDTIATKESY